MEYRKKLTYALSCIVILTSLPRMHGMHYITPALAIGGAYGTYQTLTSKYHIADSVERFVSAMTKDTAGSKVYWSLSLRALLLNFPKYFKSHEKLALIASGTGLALGSGLLCMNTLSAIVSAYKIQATNDAIEKARHDRELSHASSGILSGLFSTSVSAFSCLCLYDYITSKGQLIQ